jgi:hypothetical protein
MLANQDILDAKDDDAWFITVSEHRTDIAFTPTSPEADLACSRTCGQR